MTTYIAGFVVHPAADLFPMMSDAEMDGLVEDIRTNGQDEPIELDAAGNLIDGRNRAKACEVLGLSALTRIFHGADVWQHVISRNLHRRHLSESQRAMIAAKLATRPMGSNQFEGSSIEEPSPDPPAPTHTEAAKALGVSSSSTTRAKNVIDKGTEALQNLVTEGKATVNAATQVAQLKPEEQDAIVEKVRAGENIKTVLRDSKPKPQTTKERPPAPPTFGRRRKHAQIIATLVEEILPGALMPFDGVTELDESVTANEAARLADDLGEAMKTLRKIHNLIKERTQ